MKRRVVMMLLFTAVVVRVFSLFFLRIEPYYVVIPRSFTGRMLLAQPLWLDLAMLIIIIAACWQWRPRENLTLSDVALGALNAIGLMAFPLATGLALFVYIQDWYFGLQVNWGTIARYLQFVLAYVALNLMMDALIGQRKWLQRGIAPLAFLTLALTQDIFIRLPSSLAVGVFFSVGVTLGLTLIAFRPLYTRSPWQAILAAAFVGLIACFIVVAAVSESVFTFLLPMSALLFGAFSIRSAKRWPRLLTAAVFIGLALFLSLGLPQLVPPDIANMLVENVHQNLITEQVGGISISYPEPRLRDIAVRLARVLDAANMISEAEFGISPHVNSLTLTGIGPGGFHGNSPHSITGALASERQLQLYLDSSYLNVPDLSIHFPDPVNAILHEYAHLYGVVPYWPWIMGPEEEGWATYAATRLSLRLYETHGPELWDPPYDYAKQARAITSANLQGHPVAWSHPHEFGGFRLWYALGERDGEDALFRNRWLVTRRDLQRAVIISDPEAARSMAAAIGETDFADLGKQNPVRFSQVLPMEALASMSEVMGISSQDVQVMYETRSARLVDPGIKIPHRVPSWIDPFATFLLLAVFIGIRKSRLTSRLS